jgi:hypothetical protein
MLIIIFLMIEKRNHNFVDQKKEKKVLKQKKETFNGFYVDR